MPVSFQEIMVHQQYDCDELARRWEYSGPQPLGRGIVTPSGTPFIIVFITQESNPLQGTDEDEGLFVRLQGQREDEIDERIINAQVWGGEIHLFFRHQDHQKFGYMGIATVATADIYVDRPNRFILVYGPRSKGTLQRIQIHPPQVPQNQVLGNFPREFWTNNGGGSDQPVNGLPAQGG